MNKFMQFLKEAAEDDFKELLNTALSLVSANVKQNDVWVNANGKKVIIKINQDNYIQSEIDGKLISTQKLYKDGDVVNYDLGIKRLKEFIDAVKKDQIIKNKKEF